MLEKRFHLGRMTVHGKSDDFAGAFGRVFAGYETSQRIEQGQYLHLIMKTLQPLCLPAFFHVKKTL